MDSFLQAPNEHAYVNFLESIAFYESIHVPLLDIVNPKLHLSRETRNWLDPKTSKKSTM